MRKVKSIKLKPGFVFILKFIGIIACILLGVFIFYTKQINDLTKLGYSKEASKKILFSWKKDYVLSIGENKTLNAAFESEYFNEKYIKTYVKIDYVDQKHIIRNINKLIKKGYSNSDINIILSHGTDESVTEFTKRDKVNYLEEFFSLDYAKLENYDRYEAYSDETGENEIDTVIEVNLNLDKEDYTDSVLVDEFSTDMVINKHRHLSEDFKPNDLVEASLEYASENGIFLSRLAYNAFKSMSDAASKEGYGIVINSAYRSFQDQQDITDLYFKYYGQEYVDKYIAKPGYSEHQTGLAIDVGSKSVSIFANSKENTWMLDNAYKYGFIQRYTKRDENLTGFRYEAWHYRYVGKEIAKYCHDHNNMSLEEYFVIFLDK